LTDEHSFIQKEQLLGVLFKSLKLYFTLALVYKQLPNLTLHWRYLFR